MKTKVFFMALALVAMLGAVAAQDSKQEPAKAQTENKKSCYVDENKNGTCDKYENKTCTTGNGQGKMDGSGKGCCKADGKGQGKGQGCRKGQQGANYVDANKNGTCDKRETK